MTGTTILLFIYGILLIGGGFMGAKAGSKVSLIMGIASGLLVLLGVYLSKTSYQAGYGLICGVSGVLVIVFLMRLLKTGKLMPSGMLLILSAVALIVSFLDLIKK